MQFNRAILVDVFAILSLGLVVFGGYQYARVSQVKHDLRLLPRHGCDLQSGPCTAALADGGSVELTLAPRPIPMVAPLQVEVRVVGVAPSQVTIDFAGVVMNMGENRSVLDAVAPGLYRGKAELSVCITGTMAWRATVHVETPTQRIAIPFDFETRKRGA